MEKWKFIRGYEGIYEVSDLGNLRSKHGMLKPSMSGRYSQIHLYKLGERKGFQVSRLVALAFIPNPENKPEVNHIDGNRSNNKCSNLEWVTSSENKKHAYRVGLMVKSSGNGNAKLNDTKVKRIRLMKEIDPTMKYKDIASLFDVDPSVISKIFSRTRWARV